MIVEFVLAAEAELDDAVAYHNRQRAGSGIEFAREVDAAVKRIIEYPHVWQKLARGVRRCQLNKFKYGLVYRVQDDVATVYAVMHLKRKPGYWRKRLKKPEQG